MGKKQPGWTAHMRAARDLLAQDTGGLDHAMRAMTKWLSNERAGNPGHGSGRGQHSRKRFRRAERTAIFERDGYRCQCCGTWERLTIHHVLALTAGGTNERGNLLTLCRSCHDREEMRRDLLRVLRQRMVALVSLRGPTKPIAEPIHRRSGYRGRVMRAQHQDR